MTTFTEGRHAGEHIVSQASGTRSRDVVTLAMGNNLAAGTVLGKASIGAASTSFSGTGNGTITMDATTPVLPTAKVGDYTATCITAASDGGIFRVEDPDGYVLGDVAVGGTFSDDIKFVIADGATDFTVGAKFTITVAAGSGKYGALDLDATNGLQIAAAVLYDNVDATDADATVVVTSRDSEVAIHALTWPDGIDNDEKDAALAQLATVGIIGR
ncbi:MAG: head decoration protein [Ramlibacter sp.]|nr:head decoration protein [Ramlibacter sp.]